MSNPPVPKEAHDVPPSSSQRPTTERRKLRPLIITMGGSRRSHLAQMFAHPRLSAHFDPPTFSPGVPVRSIRNCRNLLTKANEAGLLPEAEWEALSTKGEELWEDNPLHYLDALTDAAQPGSSQSPHPSPAIPISPERHGSARDRQLHYSVELWWKSKSISRERGVLACFLAHLIAMRTLVEDEYDLILEDNVRAPLFGAEHDSEDEVEAYCECAERIWAAREASERLSSHASPSQHGASADVQDGEDDITTSKECHLRYYGWLGSKPNLRWLYGTHIPRMRARTDWDGGSNDGNGTCSNGSSVIFPYPTVEEFRADRPVPTKRPSSSKWTNEEKKGAGDAADSNTPTTGSNNADNGEEEEKGSGTPIWGAYAYWISRPAYECLLSDLRNDVGAILWRGKGMPAYIVKPIDRVLPRRTVGRFGRDAVHVATVPAFFRAPMLKSTIHSQLDVEFCKSSEYQMEQVACSGGTGGTTTCSSSGGSSSRDEGTCTSGDDSEGESRQGKCTKTKSKSKFKLGWDSLWLTDEEKRVIAQRIETGDWSFVETQRMDHRRKPRHIQ